MTVRSSPFQTPPHKIPNPTPIAAPQSMSDLTGSGGGGAEALGGVAARAEGQYAAARTSVWWDIENCAVPRNCNPLLIALNISSALDNLGYRGRVSISAYGDTNKIPDAVQRALNSTGVSLNHIPAGVKDASDKKILVDMLFWAVDNPPPSNYLLISGDRDFSNALHQLGLRKYNVLLAQPQCVSSALIAAAKSVWEWPSLVDGGPPMSQLPGARRSNISGSVKASQPSVFQANQNAKGNDNDNGNGRSANNGNGNGNVKADNDRYKAKELKNPNQPISISRVPSNELGPPVPGNEESLTSGTADNLFPTMKPGIQLPNHSFMQGESSSHPQSAAYKPTGFEGLDAKQFNDTGHHAFIPNMPKGTSGPSYTPTRSDYPSNMGKYPIENGEIASNNQLRPRDLFFQNGNLTTEIASNNQLRPRDLFFQNGNLTTLNSHNSTPPSSRPSAALPPHDRPVSATFPLHTRSFLQPINLQHARSGLPSTRYPAANLPNINYLDTAIESNKPASKKRKRESNKHLNGFSGTPMGAALPPDGFSGTPMGAAFPPDILDILGNILSTLKDEKLPPTEAYIEDCIRYGEMNIPYFFDVRSALNYALKSQYLVQHKSRKSKIPSCYTKKEEPLGKYVIHPKKYPKETWDSIKKFLSSAEGQSTMQFSQCRYQAAVRLKKACLKTVALGDILVLLNVIIDHKKWILPHATGWQPLSVTCRNTKSSDASKSQ